MIMAAVRPAEGYRVMETLIASARSGWPLTSSMPVMGALSTAPASARAHVRVTLSGWQLGEMTEFAEVVVSEAVTNAVNASTVRSGEPVYIGGRMAVIGLRLHSNRSRLLIEVYDQAPGRPVMKYVSADAESGRGLAMIDRLTGGRWAWHTVPGQPGKVVWSVLSAETP
jgi:anti-sigma regulatory factor (Ser/Thr protein kinase)